MSKIVTAEYDAENHTFVLDEPIKGIDDGARVKIAIEMPLDTTNRPWLALSGCMPKEQGEEFACAINEAFPMWKE